MACEAASSKDQMLRTRDTPDNSYCRDHPPLDVEIEQRNVNTAHGGSRWICTCMPSGASESLIDEPAAETLKATTKR